MNLFNSFLCSSIQILESLEYIHGKNYTHNDIKAQNVLLGHGQVREAAILFCFCSPTNDPGG